MFRYSFNNTVTKRTFVVEKPTWLWHVCKPDEVPLARYQWWLHQWHQRSIQSPNLSLLFANSWDSHVCEVRNRSGCNLHCQAQLTARGCINNQPNRGSRALTQSCWWYPWYCTNDAIKKKHTNASQSKSNLWTIRAQVISNGHGGALSGHVTRHHVNWLPGKNINGEWCGTCVSNSYSTIHWTLLMAIEVQKVPTRSSCYELSDWIGLSACRSLPNRFIIQTQPFGLSNLSFNAWIRQAIWLL